MRVFVDGTLHSSGLIKKSDTSHRATTIAGGGANVGAAANGLAAVVYRFPTGVAVDASGNVYISDGPATMSTRSMGQRIT